MPLAVTALRRPLELRSTALSSSSTTSSSSDSEDESLASNSDSELTSDIPEVAPPSPQFKVHLAIIRTRRALQQGYYESLSTSLASLAAVLPHSLASLGVVIPVLHRLASDITDHLNSGETSKLERKSMERGEAKATVRLRQRWTRAANGDHKGKQRQGNRKESLAWVQQASELCRKVTLPTVLSSPNAATKALLTSLEWVLLGCSTRIGLNGLRLTSESMFSWPALQFVKEILAWYLCFEGSENTRLPSNILASVRSLDLSKNQLDNFPVQLPSIFPFLEVLSLSHNNFIALPPHISLLTNLRQLKTHSNPLHMRATSHPAPPLSVAPLKPQIPPLLHIAARILIPLMPLNLPPDYLPHKLSCLLDLSYTCDSCGSFVPPGLDYCPPVFDELLFASPGISLPPSSPSIANFDIDIRVILLLEARSQNNLDLSSITYVVGPTKLCRRCSIGHHRSPLPNTSGGEIATSPHSSAAENGRASTEDCRCVLCQEALRLHESKEGVLLRWMKKNSIVSRIP